MKSKYRIAICDDEQMALSVVSSAVQTIFAQNHILCETEIFNDFKSLEDRMNYRIFDLFLLDIETPTGDGIAFGKNIRALNNAAQIIYVSNRTERVFESFAASPLAFVRKRHLLEDISLALKRFIDFESSSSSDDNVLVLKKCNGFGAYRINNIRYFEGNGNVQSVYLDKERDEVRCSLSYLEEKLVPHGFCRVHRGFLVNFAFVSDIVTGGVVMQDKTLIPISRGKPREVKLQYMKYLQQNNILIRD